MKISRGRAVVYLALPYLILLALLGAIEGGVRLWTKLPPEHEYRIVCDRPPCYTARPDSRVGYALVPNQTLKIEHATFGQFASRFTLHTDAFGRRVTPVPEGKRERFALFLGCSFTYGEDLEDDQTIPAAFAQAAPEYRPYNYGVDGYGPAQWLGQLESRRLRDEISEREGIAVLTLFEDHLRRALPSLKISLSGPNTPIYESTPDGPVFRGLARDATPWRHAWYAWLGSSALLRVMNFDWPPAGPSDRKLSQHLLGAVIRRFHDQFPTSPFFVVIYPQADALLPMAPELERAGAHVLDYHSLFDRNAPENRTNSWHPSEKAADLFARRLAEDVGRRLSLSRQ